MVLDLNSYWQFPTIYRHIFFSAYGPHKLMGLAI